ncbi:MAG TPA: hypothetical protein VG871_11910, partial [Vicinamibacterales bacterium]|nr:hypothetical protein [Vicinamibacterales bacterium]
MQLRRFAVAISAVAVGVAGVHAQAPAATGYLLPPKVIVDILDAPPTPAVIVSPERHTIALLERRSMPTIAQLAEPIYRVAGARINPRTNGRQQRTGAVTGITLQAIDASASRAVVVPPAANIANVSFSPDGHRLAFTNTTAKGIQLWIADVATGASHLVSGTDRLNATAGDPCDWLEGSTTIVCTIVPPGRGPAPAERRVPFGPNIQETTGKPSPAATYEDLIKTRFDEDVFHYYFTSQLVAYGAATPKRTPLGSAGVIEAVTASPDGRYLLVTRVKRPYSHLLPMNGFPKDVEVWTAGGKVVRRVADLPSSEGVVIAGVPTGPRQFRWRVDQPATLTWAEALDDGNPRKEVPFRDRILSLQAPFSGEPMEIAKTAWRFAGLQYTTKGAGFLSESDRRTRHVRTWLLEPGAPPRTLWDRRQDDA